MNNQIGKQKIRTPKIVRRLSRDEATAYLLEMLMGREVPFSPYRYDGGPAQLLSDAMCIGPATITNYACRGRKTL